VAAHAAVLLRERQPEQAHPAHLGDDVVGELPALVEVADDRRHLLAGERLDGGPQLLVLGGQGGGSGHRGHSCSSAGSSGAGWSGAADPAPPGGAGAGASAPAGAMVARTASMATASPGRTA